MDLLISMKAEPIQKSLEPLWKIMSMPNAQSGGYFIAEFREADRADLEFLKQLANILQNKLNGNSEFLIESTPFGFILKKKVDEDLEYMEAWERWVHFSRAIYEKLENVIKELDRQE